jgi:enterochelin esterase-like enzyme
LDEFVIFGIMEIEKSPIVLKETARIESEALGRTVTVDFYLPAPVSHPSEMSLLLINDGQDMGKLGLQAILNDLHEKDQIRPLLCVGIHAGTDRKLEYGTANKPDYRGRGALSKQYTEFILEELLPHTKTNYYLPEFREKAFAGFSLGGLSALDIVWNHPLEFSKVGVFSGSLWWRSKDKTDPTYRDGTDRIMHQLIRQGIFRPWLKFYFECGAADEEDDRNNNGIIDSIDDTLDLIGELVNKGYDPLNDIQYLQLDDGKHDIQTWARAMPAFLKWGWGK